VVPRIDVRGADAWTNLSALHAQRARTAIYAITNMTVLMVGVLVVEAKHFAVNKGYNRWLILL